jgi:hypothetical protein
MNGPARALSGADNLAANAEETVAGGLVHGRDNEGAALPRQGRCGRRILLKYPPDTAKPVDLTPPAIIVLPWARI